LLGTNSIDEFRVSTHTTDRQQRPAICGLVDGGFIVVWEGYDTMINNMEIYARRYNANGDPVTDEIRVNSYQPGDQIAPSVTGLNDGGFVIAWQSWEQDGDNWGIYLKIYNEDGTVRRDEFQVNSYTMGEQSSPVVSNLLDGGFVIAWQGNSTISTGFSVFIQMYEPDGTPRLQGCSSTEDCPLDKPFCDPTNTFCRPCVSSSECPDPKMCDISTGRCGECFSDAHCSAGPLRFCDTTTLTYKGCLDNSYCDSPNICNLTSGMCELECTSNDQCISDPTKAICDSMNFQCWGCTNLAECQPNKMPQLRQMCFLFFEYRLLGS